MENIKSWIVPFLAVVLLNIGLSLWWDSQNEYLALYNITVMTLDIMLTPLVIVLAFCLFFGTGFLKD
jgi:hypothetical protein